MPLSDFLLEWNRTHELVSFLAYKIAGFSRPISVEIRYPEIEKFDFLHDDAWKNLNQMLKKKSNGLLCIATSEYLFKMGIMDIKIASKNIKYDPYIVMDALKWLGEEFFRDKKVT